MTVPAGEPAPRWTSYWEGLDHRQIRAVEARDYVARLRAAVPVRPTDRVLDFCCGAGYVVEQLAPVVAEVAYCDADATLRRAADDRLARLPHTFPIELNRPAALGAHGRFDLVLANGAAQHMAPDELRRWISRWATLLAPDGLIVVSDIPAPRTSSRRELLGLVRLAVRNRFLVRAMRDRVVEAHRHSGSRGPAPLTRWVPEEVAALAAANALEATVLPGNLTHRARRLAVVLRRRRE